MAPEAIVTVLLASAVPTIVASPATLETTLAVPTLPMLVTAMTGAAVSIVTALVKLPEAVLPAASIALTTTLVAPVLPV